MHSIRYTITLREPAIFAAIEGEPNSALSYDFIPGSVIRGMLIGAYFQYLSDEEKEAISFDPRFFSTDVLYLNAYVQMQGEATSVYTTYPVPASWQKLKYRNDNQIYDGIFSQDLTEKTKSVTDYTFWDNDVAYVGSPKRILNVHTQRKRRRRGNEDDINYVQQQVYRYDALAAGQVFQGEIRCKNEEDAAFIFQLLSQAGATAIGGARSAGYGMVDVSILGEPDPTYIDATAALNTNSWVITLVSDLILLDDNGNYMPTTASFVQLLSHSIGTNIKAEQVENTVFSTRMIGGFNRKWGLPTQQQLALNQGSVIKLTLPAPITDVQLIEDLLQAGIGERTNEGFGQILINWQQRDVYSSGDASPVIVVQEQRYESEDGANMIALLNERLGENQFEANIAREIYGKKSANYQLSGRISPTQIARLRNVVKDELRRTRPQSVEPEQTVVDAFLKDIKGKAAAKQFDEARIGGQTFSKWLLATINEQNLTYYDRLSIIEKVLANAIKTSKERR